MLLMVWAALYGGYRALQFHPMYNRRYLQWLTMSPWNISKPFPLGPPHVVWVDVVIVGIPMLLVHTDGIFSPAYPAITFLTVYLVLWGLALAFPPEHFWRSIVAVFLLPFTAYPHCDPWLGLAVFVGLYLWIRLGFQTQFKEFPWNTAYWKLEPVERLRRGFAKKDMVGWLSQMLRLYDSGRKMSITSALGIATLVTWWLHAGLWVVAYSDFDAAAFLLLLTLGLGVPALIIGRLIAYIGAGYRPPINIWGRIFTFRWFIPKYDVVYVSPVCMALVGLLVLRFGYLLPLSDIHLFESLIFVEFFLALSLPPRRIDWWLTGAHRMVEKPKRMQQQSKIAVPVGPKATNSILG